MLDNVFQLDGSETSWLVYADYLEDQGVDSRHIREGWQVNDWHREMRSDCVGDNIVDVGIRGVVGNRGWADQVGSYSVMPGSCQDSACFVGGRNY
jgi:hypothetical protein